MRLICSCSMARSAWLIGGLSASEPMPIMTAPIRASARSGFRRRGWPGRLSIRAFPCLWSRRASADSLVARRAFHRWESGSCGVRRVGRPSTTIRRSGSRRYCFAWRRAVVEPSQMKLLFRHSVHELVAVPFIAADLPSLKSELPNQFRNRPTLTMVSRWRQASTIAH